MSTNRILFSALRESISAREALKKRLDTFMGDDSPVPFLGGTEDPVFNQLEELAESSYNLSSAAADILGGVLSVTYKKAIAKLSQSGYREANRIMDPEITVGEYLAALPYEVAVDEEARLVQQYLAGDTDPYDAGLLVRNPGNVTGSGWDPNLGTTLSEYALSKTIRNPLIGLHQAILDEELSFRPLGLAVLEEAGIRNPDRIQAISEGDLFTRDEMAALQAGAFNSGDVRAFFGIKSVKGARDALVGNTMRGLVAFGQAREKKFAGANIFDDIQEGLLGVMESVAAYEPYRLDDDKIVNMRADTYFLQRGTSAALSVGRREEEFRLSLNQLGTTLQDLSPDDALDVALKRLMAQDYQVPAGGLPTNFYGREGEGRLDTSDFNVSILSRLRQVGYKPGFAPGVQGTLVKASDLYTRYQRNKDGHLVPVSASGPPGVVGEQVTLYPEDIPYLLYRAARRDQTAAALLKFVRKQQGGNLYEADPAELFLEEQLAFEQETDFEAPPTLPGIDFGAQDIVADNRAKMKGWRKQITQYEEDLNRVDGGASMRYAWTKYENQYGQFDPATGSFVEDAWGWRGGVGRFRGGARSRGGPWEATDLPGDIADPMVPGDIHFPAYSEYPGQADRPGRTTIHGIPLLFDNELTAYTPDQIAFARTLQRNALQRLYRDYPGLPGSPRKPGPLQDPEAMEGFLRGFPQRFKKGGLKEFFERMAEVSIVTHLPAQDEFLTTGSARFAMNEQRDAMIQAYSPQRSFEPRWGDFITELGGRIGFETNPNARFSDLLTARARDVFKQGRILGEKHFPYLLNPQYMKEVDLRALSGLEGMPSALYLQAEKRGMISRRLIARAPGHEEYRFLLGKGGVPMAEVKGEGYSGPSHVEPTGDARVEAYRVAQRLGMEVLGLDHTHPVGVEGMSREDLEIALEGRRIARAPGSSGFYREGDTDRKGVYIGGAPGQIEARRQWQANRPTFGEWERANAPNFERDLAWLQSSGASPETINQYISNVQNQYQRDTGFTGRVASESWFADQDSTYPLRVPVSKRQKFTGSMSDAQAEELAAEQEAIDRGERPSANIAYRVNEARIDSGSEPVDFGPGWRERHPDVAQDIDAGLYNKNRVRGLRSQRQRGSDPEAAVEDAAMERAEDAGASRARMAGIAHEEREEVAAQRELTNETKRAVEVRRENNDLVSEENAVRRGSQVPAFQQTVRTAGQGARVDTTPLTDEEREFYNRQMAQEGGGAQSSARMSRFGLAGGLLYGAYMARRMFGYIAQPILDQGLAAAARDYALPGLIGDPDSPYAQLAPGAAYRNIVGQEAVGQAAHEQFGFLQEFGYGLSGTPGGRSALRFGSALRLGAGVAAAGAEIGIGLSLAGTAIPALGAVGKALVGFSTAAGLGVSAGAGVMEYLNLSQGREGTDQLTYDNIARRFLGGYAGQRAAYQQLGLEPPGILESGGAGLLAVGDLFRGSESQFSLDHAVRMGFIDPSFVPQEIRDIALAQDMTPDELRTRDVAQAVGRITGTDPAEIVPLYHRLRGVIPSLGTDAQLTRLPGSIELPSGQFYQVQGGTEDRVSRFLSTGQRSGYGSEEDMVRLFEQVRASRGILAESPEADALLGELSGLSLPELELIGAQAARDEQLSASIGYYAGGRAGKLIQQNFGVDTVTAGQQLAQFYQGFERFGADLRGAGVSRDLTFAESVAATQQRYGLAATRGVFQSFVSPALEAGFAPQQGAGLLEGLTRLFSGYSERQIGLAGQIAGGDLRAASFASYNEPGILGVLGLSPASQRFFDRSGNQIFETSGRDFLGLGIGQGLMGLSSAQGFLAPFAEFGNTAEMSQFMFGGSAELNQAFFEGGLRGAQDYTRTQLRENQMAGIGIGFAQVAEQRRYLAALYPLEDAQRLLGHQNQLQNFAAQQERLELNYAFGGRQADLSLRRMNITQAYQLQEMDFGYQGQLLQRAFTQEQQGFSDTLRGLQFGFQMEDLNEAIRFSSGRQRRQLVRQRGRAALVHNIEEQQIDSQRAYQDEQYAREDEQYQRRREYTEELMQLDREQFDLNQEQRETFYQLDRENLQRQREYYEESYEIQTQIIDLNREHQQKQLDFQAAQLSLQAQNIELQQELEDLTRKVNQNWQDMAGELGQINQYGNNVMIMEAIKNMLDKMATVPLGVIEAMSEMFEELGGVTPGGGAAGTPFNYE